MKIKNVVAREVLDSRGNPTVEVDVILSNDIVGSFIVPSGASTGTKEALELRDKDLSRYHGNGVLNAVNNVNTVIREKVIGMDSSKQRQLDEFLISLDGTPNKSNLGANAILGVSMANLKATAKNNKKELYEYLSNNDKMPIPMMNIINGGMHADNNIDIQEFMIVPLLDNIHDNVRAGSEIFHSLKEILISKNYTVSVGDEGGFAPNLKSNEEAFELIIEAIKKAGYKPGNDVKLAIDVAASELYKDGYYFINDENYTLGELIDYYETLIKKYPIISIEDPVHEEDYEGFSLLTKLVGDKISLVGDDLFVTNKKYLQIGILKKAGNAILIKLNQIGTFTETLDTINFAKENNYKVIISHRSGETEDTTIADLALGLGLDQIKTGSLSRSERICKYNRLMKIEDNLMKNIQKSC